MRDVTGRLVTLNKLNQLSRNFWPTLGHYIGTMGVLIRIEEDHSEGPKHNYVVQFDPSPSLAHKEDEDRLWFVEQDEISYVVLVPGTYALFRVNDNSEPALVVITAFDDVTEERPYRMYSFVTVVGSQEFVGMPEVFLRPYPCTEI